MLALRQPARRNPQRRQTVISKALTAPVEGWDASSALASMPENRAVQLKNWFPQPGFVEVRRGYRIHSFDIGSSPKPVSSIDTGTDTLTSNAHGLADGTEVKIYASTTMPGGLSQTLGYFIRDSATNTFKLALTAGGAAVNITSNGSGTITVYKLDEPPVETLAVWQGPASGKMFAAAGGAIWDVTAQQSATPAYYNNGAEDRWQWCNHTTSAGAFLFLVNGTDAPLHYNGTSWAAPTITGITAADAIHVTSHKKRLWFTMKDSTKGAYLATDAIAGAATEFQFGSLFSRGGHLLAIASWTRDGGSGSDDYLVAISSRGQLAVYAGTDPASADTWALVGVFDVPQPIGRRCWRRHGGDVLLLTVEGLFPLSSLLSVDESQAKRVAISERISNAFNTAAQSYGSLFGWECEVYPRGTRLIVNVPTSENATAKQYVMNTLTKAWCEYDGHNANTWVVFGDNLYFSGHDGDVYRADAGRADLEYPITAVGQTAYSAMGRATVKRFTMMKPLITATVTNRPALGVSVDFVETSALSTLAAAVAPSGATWDSSVWDSATFGAEQTEINDWANIAAIGTFGSIKFQAQTGVDSGSSNWGFSIWGSSSWGSGGTSDEIMRLQGFVILAEPGGHL